MFPEERERSAKEATKREGVFGFAVCGLGTGETSTQLREGLSAALLNLPREKPRLVQAALTPLDMLEAVSKGADLLDCTYASQVSDPAMAEAEAFHSSYLQLLFDADFRAVT